MKLFLVLGLVLGFSSANADSYDRLWAGQVDVIDTVAGTMVPCKIRIELSQGNYTSSPVRHKVLDIQTCQWDKVYPRNFTVLENGDLYDQFIRRVVGKLDGTHFYVADNCRTLEIIDIGSGGSKILMQEFCSNLSIKEISGYISRVW